MDLKPRAWPLLGHLVMPEAVSQWHTPACPEVCLNPDHVGGEAIDIRAAVSDAAKMITAPAGLPREPVDVISTPEVARAAAVAYGLIDEDA